MKRVFGVTVSDVKPLPKGRDVRAEIKDRYERFNVARKAGAVEALGQALRYSLARPGECGHGRETGADDSITGLHCRCPRADYVAVPRWLLEAGLCLTEPAESKGRGQHAKVTTRFLDELRDVETFHLVEAQRRAGKTLETACLSGGSRGGNYHTIRAAHRRVSRDPDRYRPAIDWARSQKKLTNPPSHFSPKRAAAIRYLFASELIFHIVAGPTLPKAKRRKLG